MHASKSPRFSPRSKRIAASLAIAVGLVMVGIGVSTGVTGKDAQKLTDEIESINPVRNATQVLAQERIFVDLVTGYTGVLILNNVELETYSLDDQDRPQPEPGQQISLPPVTIFEPGNSTLTFTPTDGAAVEQFATGINTVEVRYWKQTEGPNRAKSFTWQFDVV